MLIVNPDTSSIAGFAAMNLNRIKQTCAGKKQCVLGKIGPIDERKCEPNEIMMPTETTLIANSYANEQNADIKLDDDRVYGISADYFCFFCIL